MDIILLVFMIALGACVGSFLNVVIWRLPRGESIVFPPSHCPSCGNPITWYDNIPLVSWFVLRGQCRACKAAISPRYLLIEAATAALVGGLYACYYLLDIRNGLGPIATSWPVYATHAALLCGLLACSAVDVDKWIVPLEVCWFLTLVALVAMTAAPPSQEFLPRISPAMGAASIAAAVGLAIALLLQRVGLLQQSFLDADEREAQRTEAGDGAADKNEPRITGVAIGKEHGVNPRREILREVVFLAPAILLALGAHAAVTHVEAVRTVWENLNAEAHSGRFARHFAGFQAALFGYLIGGLWIWGTRILGTLGFGREAMGLGDVHLLAAVGAATGWIVPTLTFFLAPFFGLLWALHLWLGRKQRELPYGPWLAAAALMVILFYDGILEFLTSGAPGLGRLLH